MTEIEQPPQNGIDVTTEDDENNKARPADIEQDMREMERRKRVEAIMGSKLFREELERIVDSAREGGTTGILQQLSDIVGLPSSRLGNVLKASNCMVPINDIRGVESMGYAKGEKILRCKLAATFRLLDLYGWTHGLGSQVTARLKVDQEIFLVNPYGMLYHEITASSLNKVDMQGQVVEQGTTNFGVNKNHFILHSIVHAARPDIRCAIYIGCSPVVAVSALKIGLLPITLDACVLGEITTHSFSGSLIQTEERDKLVRNLGPNSKVILLTNHGALCCGESIEEAFFLACHIVHACETQLKLLPIGVENIVLIPEESRKDIYEQARRPPEDLEKKFAAALANIEKTPTAIGEEDNKNDVATKTAASAQKAPNWRVGGAEFEALMRMLDNAGYRTGYIYRHPLVKSELPKPKNDVELPPAVSSLGYLLEEEELYRQGIWKKGDPRKSGDRCRWLNSPNVYQKVEVLETGTPDPKKITKWIAEGSPTHGTPVRIEDALQFVPAGTNTKEFKRVQQQIKDNRRADKISAGPQSQILEGVTWDEANRIKDATVSSAGDHVVLMGAASKGIIQRGFQHNATVYKTPYAKNPFDNVTDDELNEYKRTVERKKKSIHGEYTDTDFSETEALSSVHASAGPTLMKHSVATINHSEPEDVSEHQVMRIETQQAPVPSQPEVILSDAVGNHLSNLYTSSYAASSLISWDPVKSSQIRSERTILQKINREKLHSALKYAMLFIKYSFLFEKIIFEYANKNTIVFMIHKIELFPHYTYPLANECTYTLNSNLNNGYNPLRIMIPPSKVTTPPYRTVSHYGFNYPLSYMPSVAMYPTIILTAVEVQRQKVIEYINSTAFEYLNKSSNNEFFYPIKRFETKDVKPMIQSFNSIIKTDVNGSYISVKEIQLEPNPRRQRFHSKGSKHSLSSNQHATTGDELDNHELTSDKFSSLLSITGSYPAVSNQSPSATDEHDFHDQGENESNASIAGVPSTEQASNAIDNNYNYSRLSPFVPIDYQSLQESHKESESYCDGINQKPESEQALDCEYKMSQASYGLSLNTLNHSSTNKLKLKIKDNYHYEQNPKAEKRQFVLATENSNRPSPDSTVSLNTIEIHINVVVKNSECEEKLQNHEQEFKCKLEKVIDDEIKAIMQHLTEQHKQTNISTVIKHAGNAPNSNIYKGHFQRPSDAAIKNKFQLQGNKISSPGAQQFKYADVITLLEHELENLFNDIIRANELHNLAIMCDCKSKITKLSQDIRESLDVVGGSYC